MCVYMCVYIYICVCAKGRGRRQGCGDIVRGSWGGGGGDTQQVTTTTTASCNIQAPPSIPAPKSVAKRCQPNVLPNTDDDDNNNNKPAADLPVSNFYNDWWL